MAAAKGNKYAEKKINWEEFDKLCSFQCTLQEIAAWFNCSVDGIEKKCKKEKGMKFSDYYKEKRKIGLISLRRKQMQVALAGNVTMLIFLGKQYLGQSDKVDHTTKGDSIKPIEVVVSSKNEAKIFENTIKYVRNLN